MMFRLVVAMVTLVAGVVGTGISNETSSFITENGDVYGSKIVMAQNGTGRASANNTATRSLTQYTFSIWVKVSRNMTSQSNGVYLFMLRDTFNAMYIKENRMYAIICGRLTARLSYDSYYDKWVHIVINGRYRGSTYIYMNGQRVGSQYSSCYMSTGGSFILGGNTPQGYRLEFAYANFYDFATYSPASLKNIVYSDPRALVRWESFVKGHHNGTILERATDVLLLAASGIHCAEDQMNITLSRKSFRYLIPTQMSLQNASCKASRYNEQNITFDIPLNKCGTSRHIDTKGSMVSYTNWIYPDYNQQDSRTSKPIAFVCTYNYDLTNKHAFISAYWIVGGKDVMHRYAKGRKAFPLEVNLYKDEEFRYHISKEDYPLKASSKDPIFATVGIPKESEVKICIKIRSCFLNLSNNPEMRPKHDLIVEGKTQENVKVYEDPLNYQRRFSFLTTEVGGHEEEDIYLHCYMDTCSE